jgi:hypothetical protein
MKTLWPEHFEENSKPSAKNLLEEQANLLAKITDGIVSAEVIELDKLNAMRDDVSNEFCYRFNIVGPYLQGYKFKVMSFSHDITLYPVVFSLDEELGKELDIKEPFGGYKATVADPIGLEAFIGCVLTSQRIKNVVGSIMRLSK